MNHVNSCDSIYGGFHMPHGLTAPLQPMHRAAVRRELQRLLEVEALAHGLFASREPLHTEAHDDGDEGLEDQHRLPHVPRPLRAVPPLRPVGDEGLPRVYQHEEA